MTLSTSKFADLLAKCTNALYSHFKESYQRPATTFSLFGKSDLPFGPVSSNLRKSKLPKLALCLSKGAAAACKDPSPAEGLAPLLPSLSCGTEVWESVWALLLMALAVPETPMDSAPCNNHYFGSPNVGKAVDISHIDRKFVSDRLRHEDGVCAPPFLPSDGKCSRMGKCHKRVRFYPRSFT